MAFFKLINGLSPTWGETDAGSIVLGIALLVVGAAGFVGARKMRSRLHDLKDVRTLHE